MKPQQELLADPTTVVAVVGATDTPGKYGGIIYRDLRARGHLVLAVNRNRRTVAGDPAYPTLTALPRRPDIVNMVVSPADGEGVLTEWIGLEGKSVWFQPGAHNTALVEKAKEAGMEVVAGSCIMVVSRRLSASA